MRWVMAKSRSGKGREKIKDDRRETYHVENPYHAGPTVRALNTIRKLLVGGEGVEGEGTIMGYVCAGLAVSGRRGANVGL